MWWGRESCAFCTTMPKAANLVADPTATRGRYVWVHKCSSAPVYEP